MPVQRPNDAAPCASIIVIFHNEIDFLEEAVESVLGQEFRDLELILFANGATPECLALASSLHERHPDRIRLLTHPDEKGHGLATTRRAGVDASRGRYVGFLDADDLWLPGKLAEQIAILDADPELGMVYGRTLIWYSWQNNPAREDFYYPLGLQPDRAYRPYEPLCVLVENRSQSPKTCNALMRREAIVQAVRQSCGFERIMEDQEQWALIMAHWPTWISSRTWALYRQRNDSLTARFDAWTESRERTRLLVWLRGYLQRSGLGDARLSASLRREIRDARIRTVRTFVKRIIRKAAPGKVR